MTDEPLTISDQGAFWVGIERVERPFGLVAAGQMFVQYQIPALRRQRHPLVMVHGGGGQGLDYIATPDGRPGWATYFLRQGYAVYVVDRVAHGRSPYHPDVQGPATPPPSYQAFAARMTAPEKTGAYPQAKRHTQWPGSGEVGDPALDQFMAGQGPNLAGFVANQEAMKRCGTELMDRLGPAIVMTHSMGGPFGWIMADARPKLVKAVIAIEPVGPPFMELPGLGALDWGVTAIPLTYDPPAREPADLKRSLRPTGDATLKDCFMQAEPARQLVNLKGIPILLVTAEASWIAQTNHGTCDYLAQAGATIEHLRLEDAGIRGNGHMMMCEKNSDEVAAVLAQWLVKLRLD
jgi:pimeloyl-ACP methyl ester carboxylesterase